MSQIKKQSSFLKHTTLDVSFSGNGTYRCILDAGEISFTFVQLTQSSEFTVQVYPSASYRGKAIYNSV